MFRSGLRPLGLGVIGEVTAGLAAGAVSTWNTPLENLRIRKQAEPRKNYGECWTEMRGEGGEFRSVGVRMLQSAQLTVWLVVLPNLMGI